MARRSPIVPALAVGLAGLSLAACQTLKPKPAPPPPPVAETPSAPAPAAPPPPMIHPPPPAPARVSCVPKTLAKPPKYPDSEAALREAGGAADRYQLMAAGRLLRIQRLAELEKTVEGCR